MNFKRFHESKNLWSAESTISKGSSPEYYVAYLSSFPLQKGTYTFSAQITAEEGVTHCTLSFRDLNNTQMAVTSIATSSTRTSVTISFNKPCYRVYLYGNLSSGSSKAVTYSNIMVNTGSTPLPYEPYEPYGASWTDIPHYIHNTSTDTITTLPADIYANDTTATVGLKGQMVQSGTPTPTTPIQPQECGDLTGNLFDKTKATLNAVVTSDAGERPYTGFAVSDYISVLEGTYYLTNVAGSKRQITLSTFDAAKTFTGTLSISGSEISSGTVTIDNNTKYIRVNMSMTDNNIDSVMVNTGSTALPYEPFGYKIPILNNSQTTNVYLGEVQSTRKIKKLVFDGTENWRSYTGAASHVGVVLELTDMLPNGRRNGCCTHFQTQYTPAGSAIDGVTFGANDKNCYLTFSTDIGSVKTWLAAQYSAGTPVTVWYVLATPQTAVVNEPLRKIGDYADEVSGITIPTIAGENTLSIGTTLQPSEVTATYKGWHSVADVHERESGQWD